MGKIVSRHVRKQTPYSRSACGKRHDRFALTVLPGELADFAHLCLGKTRFGRYYLHRKKRI